MTVSALADDRTEQPSRRQVLRGAAAGGGAGLLFAAGLTAAAPARAEGGLGAACEARGGHGCPSPTTGTPPAPSARPGP
ncbi:hypothetical protein OIE69_32920 [Actinacidiphila glaucinigra]|uniref:hypothetical protein n=1 Tax=Actinacidiphila glaucinigra TaxID=235986 RepID=UPI002DD7B677|nr:hypothetical protein [Actinacidiphila glaucinigra]WSD65713.1 hypothetical protein OIE69_32920 [Actinacidiphila glaucinigra]